MALNRVAFSFVRYSRELNLDHNTHLITDQPKGAKYELASSSNPPLIQIVTPSWLISTSETGQRALEIDHRLQPAIHAPEQNPIAPIRSLVSLANDVLDEDYGDNTNNPVRPFLFERFHFYLIGFEGNPELKQKIGKLVRRGGGTIHWDLDGDVSILLISDTCHKELRKAAEIVSSHHSNYPPMVSPLWAIESYKKSALQPVSSYPPIEEKHLSPNNKTYSQIKNAAKGSKIVSTTSSVSIFRGCFFSLVRSSTGHLDSSTISYANIDFDQKQLEHLIKAHGGQILSAKLVDALRADNNQTTRGSAKRKCHVVCWGDCPPRLDIDPLASKLEREELCDMVFVTPIWLNACVSVKKCIRPERMPLALQPQSWSMKSVLSLTSQKGGNRTENSATSKHPSHRNQRLEIALTGFQGTEKVVIVHLIEAMGGVYHASMSNASSHLVFKKNPTGLKLEKASEWGLHIVSIEWLYHILRYGYGGIHKDVDGCEKRYSFDGGS